MKVKTCPTCQRTYSDEAISFCLVDGSVLSAPYDPDATLRLSSNNVPSFSTTEVMPSPVSSTGASKLSKLIGRKTGRVVFGAISGYLLAVIVASIFTQSLYAILIQCSPVGIVHGILDSIIITSFSEIKSKIKLVTIGAVMGTIVSLLIRMFSEGYPEFPGTYLHYVLGWVDYLIFGAVLGAFLGIVYGSVLMWSNNSFNRSAS